MEKEEVEKLAHGTGVTLAGGVANSAFNYLSGVAISRFVGPELVGVYFLSLVWTQLASAFGRLGFSDGLLRFVPPARLRGDDVGRKRIVRTMVVVGSVASVFIGALLALGVASFGAQLGFEPLLTEYLPWFLLLIPAHVLLVLLLMTVQAHQDMTPVVLVRDVLQPGLLCIGTVLLLMWAPPRFAMAAGFGLSLLVGVAVIGVRVRALLKGIPRGGWMAAGPLLAFSFPVMLSDVSHYLYRWIDTITISVFLELRDVGIYNAAVRTSLLIGLIFMATNAIYSTMASGYFHTGQHDRLRSALHLSTRWCFMLALPIVVVLWVGSGLVLSVWGGEFVQGSDVLSLLVFAQLLTIPSGILAYTLLMCERQVMELVDTLVCLGLVLVFNLVLIPTYGLMGAAASLLLANVIGMGLRWVQVYRAFGMHPFDGKIVKPLLAGGIAAAVGFAARSTVVGWMVGLPGGPDGVAASLAALAVLGVTIGVVFLAVQLAMGFEDEDKTIPAMLLAKVRGAPPEAEAP